MHGRRWIAIGSALLALTLMSAACGGDGDSDSGGSTGSSGSTGSTGSGGSVAISIKNFAFDPSALTVTSGPTDITITNNDTATHTFTLDDGSVDESIQAGEMKTVTVDISATAGFHCSIHTTMAGTLTVT
jgi:plastocyanin